RRPEPRDDLVMRARAAMTSDEVQGPRRHEEMHLSQADHSATPPRVEIPRDYNAAHDLLQRNAARSGKVAYIDATTGQRLTYGQLAEQAHRFASALRREGFAPESRVLVAMHDT